MKEKLLKLLQAKEARKTELGQKANATEDIKELRGINTELEALNGEIAELRGMIDAIKEETPSAAPPSGSGNTPSPEQRSAGPVGATQVLAAYGIGTGAQAQTEHRAMVIDDPYGTVAYRQAFKIFATAGQVTPELRANATTTTGDVSAVIPSTILNEVIRKVTEYGQIFSRVRKLNVKGGLTIPILSLLPVATWIGETAVSDKQKVQANSNISFSYFGLECKVSTSLLADTVSLAGFESIITDLIVEATVKALDLAVLKGDGTGKCLGVTVDPRVPTSQIVTLATTEFATWEGWKKKVFAKMPLHYKAGAAFFMASGTFEGYIDGMVDVNGQPIGRINYGITNGAQERFGGKEVIQVEDDIIAPYDDAAAGDVVAVYCNLKNYGFNSNMQMMMFRYFDHDTNEWIDKAILIADGKLIDPNGVVIVKKGA
jgi:HK97 family phage major capsid protein